MDLFTFPFRHKISKLVALLHSFSMPQRNPGFIAEAMIAIIGKGKHDQRYTDNFINCKYAEPFKAGILFCAFKNSTHKNQTTGV